MNHYNVKRIVSNILMENCYIVYDDKNALIIDPGNTYFEVMDFVTKNKLKILAVLLTHGHFDHCLSCKSFQQDGALIYIHKLDEDKLYTDGNLSTILGIEFPFIHADVTFVEGILNIGEFEVDVIHTPGHSKGSVCYIIGDCFFSGDTFFAQGIGRTDFYDGNFKDMQNSLNKLKSYLKMPYKFYYGH